MGSVETELWNIFTYYSLHGDPLDPDHIRASQMVKLARDSQLIGSALSEADPPLSEADVNVAYTAEVTRAGKVAAGAGGDRRKCNFNDFLTVLMKLAIKVYPRSKSVDDAFQRLLMDNVLPLASRRAPDDISMFLENDDVRRLAEYYGDALEQIFSFYATADKRTHAQIASLSASAALAAGGAGMSLGGRPPAGGRATKSSNSMKEALSYPAFLTFAAAFDLSNSVLISNVELGDIYLSSLKNVTPDASSRKLSYDEFFEALVRCALVGYSKVSDVSVLDKIRGLFLYMWRAINKSVPKEMAARSTSTYAGDLLAGSMLFNKRFTAAWASDNYRDYLAPQTASAETGKAVLARLTKGGGGGGGFGASGLGLLGASGGGAGY